MSNPSLAAIAVADTERDLVAAQDAAYAAIEASVQSPAGRAVNNTRVLRAVSERRKQLGLVCPASHEDLNEPLSAAAQERLRVASQDSVDV